MKRVLAAVIVEPCRNSVRVSMAQGSLGKDRIEAARRAQPAENPTELNLMRQGSRWPVAAAVPLSHICAIAPETQ